MWSSLAVIATCQVQLQVNEGSDEGSDEDDDDNDNDTSASSPRKSDVSLSPAEDKDTETNSKLQLATDRLSESQSSSGLTVTPIKIKCHPKHVRTIDRILHLKHSRRRGRPPLTQNVSLDRRSFGSLSTTLSPAATSAVAKIGKVRGRPKGSKNKVKKWPLLKAKQSDKNKQNGTQLTTDTLDVGNFSSADWQLTIEKDHDRRECLDEVNNSKKSKQTFWRPPTDAESRRVLDQISITDITANALTVTVRESTTQDGFFTS